MKTAADPTLQGGESAHDNAVRNKTKEKKEKNGAFSRIKPTKTYFQLPPKSSERVYHRWR